MNKKKFNCPGNSFRKRATKPGDKAETRTIIYINNSTVKFYKGNKDFCEYIISKQSWNEWADGADYVENTKLNHIPLRYQNYYKK